MSIRQVLWPESREQDGYIIRLGRALHWLGFGVAAFLLIAVALIALAGEAPAQMEAWAEVSMLIAAIAASGRFLRYVLAGE